MLSPIAVSADRREYQVPPPPPPARLDAAETLQPNVGINLQNTTMTSCPPKRTLHTRALPNKRPRMAETSSRGSQNHLGDNHALWSVASITKYDNVATANRAVRRPTKGDIDMVAADPNGDRNFNNDMTAAAAALYNGRVAYWNDLCQVLDCTTRDKESLLEPVVLPTCRRGTCYKKTAPSTLPHQEATESTTHVNFVGAVQSS